MICAHLPMRKNKNTFFLLAVAWLIIITSDFLMVRNKVLFGGDEVISYLCATGNAGNYEEVLHKFPPYGKLVDAAEYKKYLEISEPKCFKKIATDLCTDDMHPPLYFWLLHLFVLNFGVTIFTGILLNMTLQLITLFFVFKLANHFFNDEHKSTIAALIWAISPACVGVSMNARPYELLALITVLYLFFFFKWLTKQSKLNIIMLVLFGTLGMLSHYSFMYVMTACIIFSLVKIKEIKFRNWSVILVAAIVSFELMTIIHPCYFDSFIIQQQRKQLFLLQEIPFRIIKIVLSLIQFVIPVFSAKSLLMKFNSHVFNLILVLISVLSGILILVFRRKLFPKIHFQKLIPETWQLLLILSAIIFLPYLFFITPVHAMGEQYLVYLYPLMAIVLLQINLSFSKRIKAAILSVMLLGSCLSLFLTIQTNQNEFSKLISYVEKSKVIVINNIDRRAFPRLIPYLKPGQQILMDENITNENDSLMKPLLEHKPLLFINKNSGEKFDANDGVIFYVNFFEEKK